MSSLTSKDRVSLCLFSFTDGRRCRTPRTGNHPHFCFYHAQKEARAQAAETLAKDLACFFSGDYLSACDLSTALSRLIPAVVRGDIKPRLARTIAYMVHTLVQTIHLSQDEYINAFSTDGWRKAIRTSVNTNYDYRFPPDPQSEQPAPPLAQAEVQPQAKAARATQPRACAPAPALQPRPTPAPAPQSPVSHPAASSPHASSPNQSAVANAQPSRPNSAPAQSAKPAANPAVQTPQPTSPITQPAPAAAALSVAGSIFRRRPNTTSANSFNTNIYKPPRNH
jgi:hypothetical protein